MFVGSGTNTGVCGLIHIYSRGMLVSSSHRQNLYIDIKPKLRINLSTSYLLLIQVTNNNMCYECCSHLFLYLFIA